MAEFLTGRPNRMLEKVLKRRKEINLLLRLELTDGSLETDPRRIDTAAKKYFSEAFAEAPLQGTARLLFQVSFQGSAVRKLAADGLLTESDRGDIEQEDWDVLVSMWKRKLVSPVTDGILADFTEDEWTNIW
jgi:hypothetical protein